MYCEVIEVRSINSERKNILFSVTVMLLCRPALEQHRAGWWPCIAGSIGSQQDIDKTAPSWQQCSR